MSQEKQKYGEKREGGSPAITAAATYILMLIQYTVY
mgnify:CR=1 FL=1